MSTSETGIPRDALALYRWSCSFDWELLTGKGERYPTGPPSSGSTLLYLLTSCVVCAADNVVWKRVYTYVAESGCCMRQCCGNNRGFVLHITNNFNQVCGWPIVLLYFSAKPILRAVV